MKVRVLQRVHHEGRFREPGEIVEIEAQAIAELPRWCVEERDLHPANSPKRSMPFGWSTAAHEPE